MDQAISPGRDAVVGAMQSMYFLVKQEIHIQWTTGNADGHDPELLWLLKHLEQGANAKYTSKLVIQEFLNVLANQIWDEAFDRVRESSIVGLMADETTDIAVIKELGICVR